MYYGRKKGIIIGIVIIVLLLVLGIGGFFVYANTDLFKSNETLFLKYMMKGIENLEYTQNTQMEEILKLQQQEAYTVSGTANIEYNQNGNDIKNLQDLKLTLNQNVDKSNSKGYADFRLNYKNQDIFKLEYAQNDNLYALKSDEIVTAYIGLKNENLNVLTQKLGISNASSLPNTVKAININELLEMSSEEKEHIQETYLKLIMDNISKENYTKQSNMAITKNGVSYNTTAYRLDLTSDEVKNILTAILENLKQDSITLNLIATKSKLLGLSEDYTNVNNLNSTITNLISQIKYSSNICKDGISFVVYVDNGKIISTEILIKNERKFTIYDSKDASKNYIYGKIEDLTLADQNVYEIEITQTKDLTQSTLQLSINANGKLEIDVNITNKGSAAEKNLNTNVIANINIENNTLNINYEQQMKFDNSIEKNIIELNSSNCAILNDYTTEQIQLLTNAILQRTIVVFNQKLQILGINNTVQTTETQTNTTIQENNAEQ